MARPLKYPQLANLKMVGDVARFEVQPSEVTGAMSNVWRYAKRHGFTCDVRIDVDYDRGPHIVVERRS